MSPWANNIRPILALAPMEEVTDAAYRQIIAKYSGHGTPRGGPDVFFTEFTSADGLDSEGCERVSDRLIYSEGERPIVAQIWSAKPEKIFAAARIVRERGFDGVDINMGCPDAAVCKAGAGAALIKNPGLARELIAAAREGADGLPVSVKTRTGFSENDIDGWIGTLLDTKPAAITVHARTKKELSLVPAHWEEVRRAVELAKGTDTLILGNGDLMSVIDAEEKCRETGADGAMLGRAIYGNPWLFNRDISRESLTLEERLRVMVEHAELFEQLFASRKNFAEIKKHLHAYASGFGGAKQLRVALMEAKTAQDVHEVVEVALKNGLK